MKEQTEHIFELYQCEDCGSIFEFAGLGVVSLEDFYELYCKTCNSRNIIQLIEEN